MSYEQLLSNAKHELQMAKDQVNAEIRAYPTPISGCDAQFNHLLAEQNRIVAALAELEHVVFIPNPRTPTPNPGVESW